KCQRRGMLAKKLLNRTRLRRIRAARLDRPQELDELFASAGRKAVDGVRHDVCMDVLAEMKADGHAAWPGIVRIVIGDGGEPGEVGEPDGHRCRFARRVRSTGQ